MFTNKTEQMNLVRNSNKIKSNEPSPGDTNGAVSPPNAFNTSNIKLQPDSGSVAEIKSPKQPPENSTIKKEEVP